MARFQKVGWALLLCIFATSDGTYGQDMKLKGLGRWPGFGQKTVGFSFYGNSSDRLADGSSGDRLAEAIRRRKVPQYVLNAEVACLNAHEISAKEIRAIATLKSIERLDIGIWPDAISEISTPAIDQLVKLKNLEYLKMDVYAPSKTKWNSLGKIQSLKWLHVFGCYRNATFRQQDCDAIGDLSSLTWLKLDAKIECQDFTWLTRMKSLEDLDLIALDDQGDRSPDALRQIASSFKDFPDLLHLHLEGTKLGQKEFEALAIGCGQTLESMELDLKDAKALEKLGLFPKIDQLFLTINSQEDCDLTAISKLKHLKILKIDGGIITDAELAKLRNHRRLERLEINGKKLTMDSMDVLKSIPSLNSIWLSGAPQDIQRAAANIEDEKKPDPKVEKKTPAKTPEPSIYDIEYESKMLPYGYRGIDKQGRTVYFSFFPNKLGKFERDLVASSPHLLEVDYRFCYITDDDLKSLTKCKKIQVVGIGEPAWLTQSHKVTNKGLKTIGELKSLRELEISCDRFTEKGAKHRVDDEGIKHLENLKKLETLTLRGDGFTDKSVESILKLPSLLDLDITFTKISKKGIARIKKKFPDLNFEYADSLKDGS